MTKRPPILPQNLRLLAPKREDYQSQADYEEARAYFRHRTRHLAVDPSRASHSG
jgi:hypothetical protein